MSVSIAPIGVENWCSDEYDSNDSKNAIPGMPALLDNSIIPDCDLSNTNKEHLKPSDINVILSQLEANGCDDIGAQIDWPSVDSVPVASKEILDGVESLDIHRGKLKNRQQLVAVTCFQKEILPNKDLTELKNVAREISIWSKCKHPNVLELIGVTAYQGHIAMVTPWAEYLDLHKFLSAHPQADRYILSTRIAYGVAYLHGKNIVHGLIMGGNINVMRDHTPKITGFCEMTLLNSGFTGTTHPSRARPHYSTARWMPPEILVGESDKNTQGDVYSLGMTILETMTGAVPYEGQWNGAAVLRIANGHHPQRPIVQMPDENEKANMLWTLLVECWSSNPQNRPTSVEVLGRPCCQLTDIVSGSWMHTTCQCAPNPLIQSAHIASDTVIHRKMSVKETLSHLYEHGCRDATLLINKTEYSSYPVSYGGFGEVYKGQLNDGSRIALKCLRLGLDSSDASQKQIRNAAHELYIWSKCNHPNVLELIGVTQHRNQIAMVSPWMEHGTLGGFICKHPQVDRYALSSQIADGVAYLHRENIVHGDIKGTNILISKDHTPKITDFGTATLKEYTLKFTASATTSRPGMSLRWTAPEILEESTGPSFKGDIYALAMTILETMTGEVPYSETINESALVLKIARQEHPMRPEGVLPSHDEKANRLWSLLINCWSYEPDHRPVAVDAQKTLRDLAFGRTPESASGLTGAE